jgi:hypothetical protein
LVVVVLVVAAVVAAGFFLGAIIKKGVETAGPMITKTDVKLDSANLALLSGSGQLKGFNLSVPMLGGKTAPVPLPDIHLANLGTGPEGITAAELSDQLLRTILESPVSLLRMNWDHEPCMECGAE